MGEKLQSIKVTAKTIDNLNMAAGVNKEYQYEAAEIASEKYLTETLKKISTKIKKQDDSRTRR